MSKEKDYIGKNLEHLTKKNINLLMSHSSNNLRFFIL